MPITLHVFPPSPRAFKVLVTAELLGLDYETCIVDFSKGDNKKPEYLALNPNGKMPLMVDDGFPVWESNAILQCLAAKKPGLIPTDEKGRIDVLRWQFWEAQHWDPAVAIFIYEYWVKPTFGLGPADPAEVTKGEERFNRFARVLDDHLKGKTFLLGDQLTIADISIAAPLIVAEMTHMPVGPYKEIQRWFAAISTLPAWQKTLKLAMG